MLASHVDSPLSFGYQPGDSGTLPQTTSRLEAIFPQSSRSAPASASCVFGRRFQSYCIALDSTSCHVRTSTKERAHSLAGEDERHLSLLAILDLNIVFV